MKPWVPRYSDVQPSASRSGRIDDRADRVAPRYRMGFAMTTSLGNRVAAENLHKYVMRDESVDLVWTPVNHWITPDPYGWLPGPLHAQAVLNTETRELQRQWRHLDAVAVHAFQLFAYLAAFKRFRRRPLLVLNQDYAPIDDLDFLRGVGKVVVDGPVRRVRLSVERAFTRQADIVVARTEWAAKSFIEDCDIPSERVFLNPHGVDLELWPERQPRDANEVPRLLFVGGDFEPKGGGVLLDIFRDRFAGRAELHLL